jgi:choloylglycine hydrolase
MRKTVVAMLLCCILSVSVPGFACSLMMNTNNQGTFVGRTTEWYSPIQTRAVIYPRNFAYHDDFTGTAWTGKYGIVAFEQEGMDSAGATEGINEKGLTAHLLFQDDMRAPALTPGKPKVDFIGWARYVLSTSANVKEAVADLRNYQIVIRDFVFQGTKVHVPVHFALNDATGDAAIIEFNGGKLQVFHGAQYRVMTNEPNLPAQLARLRRIKQARKSYSVAALPGGASPENRFVRASFFMESMPQPQSPEEAVAFMEEALDGLTVPAFDEKKHPNDPRSDAWEGRWRVVYDLRNLSVYFDETNTGKKLYFKLSSVDFNAAAPKVIAVKDQKSAYTL